MRLRAAAPPAALLALVLAAWEGVVRGGLVDELLLPAPTQIAGALWRDRLLLASDLAVTAVEVLVGLATALLAGAALAVAMHLSAAVRRTLRPLVIGSQAIPIVTVAPLLILALGFGLAPKVLIVALVCFFPVAIGILDGLRAVDSDQRKVLRSFDASRRQTFLLLEAPSALPQAFTGARIAAAVAVIGAVFAEWSGSDAGLGRTLLTANAQLLTERAFACVVLLFALAVALYAAFALLERRLVDWAPRPDSPGGP